MQHIDASEAERLAHAMVDTADGLIGPGWDLDVVLANHSFYIAFRATREDTEQQLYSLGQGRWDIAGLRAKLDSVILKTVSMEDYEIDEVFYNWSSHPDFKCPAGYLRAHGSLS